MYLPLRFIADNKEYAPGEAFDTIKKVLSQACRLPDDLSEDEYTKFMSSSDFLNPDYKGKLHAINDMLIANAPGIIKQMGVTISKDSSIMTELKDVYLFPVLTDQWSRYKQVYRVDEDFANALLCTDDLSLSHDMIKRLPYWQFYIDLEKCHGFAPAKGLFVHVADLSEKQVEFAVYLITEDLLFFSQYITGIFDENGIMNYDTSTFGDYIPYLSLDGDTIEEYSNQDAHVSRQRISFFALQLISYLASKEPDIEADPTTNRANPYQPGIRIKNKFSEISREEIGVRVGSKIRVSIRRMTEARAEMHAQGHHSSGTPKIPHVRSAHWSHYWTGKGRTVYETRWIEPCFVNCGINDNKPMTIHDIR